MDKERFDYIDRMWASHAISEDLEEFREYFDISYDELEEYEGIYAKAITDYWAGRNWISVEEKLPESCQNVILFTSRKNVTIGDWDGYDWTGRQGKSHRLLCGVTHWMPLPEPPNTK